MSLRAGMKRRGDTMPRRTVYEKKANLVGTASSLHPTKQTKSNEHKSNAHTTGTGRSGDAAPTKAAVVLVSQVHTRLLSQHLLSLA